MNVPMNRIQMESKYTPLFDISKEDIIYMDRGQKSSRNNEQRSSFIKYSELSFSAPPKSIVLAQKLNLLLYENDFLVWLKKFGTGTICKSVLSMAQKYFDQSKMFWDS